MGCKKLTYYNRELDLKVTGYKAELTPINTATKARREYVYGFNGQERDDEVSGSGNSYTAPYWQYSPRVVHRWNLDPKPNPSISPYAIMAGNPILYSDPYGDTVKTNQAVFNDINDALNSSLDDRSPFGFDEETEALTFDNNFDRESFGKEQLQLIDRFAKSVTSENHNVNVFKVDVNDKLDVLGGISLADFRKTGITTVTELHLRGQFVVGSEQEVHFAGNPLDIVDGKLVKALSWRKNLTILHEIGGHAFENIANPYLGTDFQNLNVENFENNVIRKIFAPKGTPIGSEGVKHPRSKEFHNRLNRF